METEGACYVVVDIESTGLSAQRDRVVSVAASCRGLVFSQFVNPGMPIPKAATKVHGITNAAVRSSPKWNEVATLLWEWFEDQRRACGATVVTLVAHNGSFDARFLAAEMARLHAQPRVRVQFELIDTLKVCRARLRVLTKFRQADVYRHLFGEEAKDQHSAEGDVLALTRICQHPSISGALSNFRVPLELCPPKADRGPPLWKFTKRPAVGAAPEARVRTTPPEARIKPTPPVETCSTCGDRYSTFFKHACSKNA